MVLLAIKMPIAQKNQEALNVTVELVIKAMEHIAKVRMYVALKS